MKLIQFPFNKEALQDYTSKHAYGVSMLTIKKQVQKIRLAEMRILGRMSGAKGQDKK